MGRAIDKGHLIMFIFLLTVAWLVLYPMLMLVYTSFTSEVQVGYTFTNYVRAYSGSGPYILLLNSLIYAGGASILSALLGTANAFIIERTNVPAKRILGTLIFIPWLVPPLLTTIAWILMLGPNAGIINIFLQNLFNLNEPPFNVFSMPAMIFVTGLGMSPLLFIIVSATMRSMDPALEEAALCAGGSHLRTFFYVTLPLVLPSILSAWMLQFIVAMENFATPLLLGLPVRIMVFTTMIYEVMHIEIPPDFPLACTYSMAPLLICLSLVLLYRLKVSAKATERFATISGKGLRAKSLDIRKWRFAALGVVCVYLFLSFVLPITILVARSFFGYNWPNSIWDIPKNATLSNYMYLFDLSIFVRSLTNSLFLALAGATILMFLATLIAYISLKTKLPGRMAVSTLGMLPIGVPSIVLAMGLLTAYAILPVMIYATIWILLIGYVTRTTPLGLTSITPGILQIHKELDESAVVCGASKVRVFIRIILPLLKHAFLAGWILAFSLLVREMDQSVLLYSYGSEVLAVVIYSFFEDGRFAQASAMAVLVLLIIVSTYIISSRFLGVKPVPVHGT